MSATIQQVRARLAQVCRERGIPIPLFSDDAVKAALAQAQAMGPTTRVLPGGGQQVITSSPGNGVAMSQGRGTVTRQDGKTAAMIPIKMANGSVRFVAQKHAYATTQLDLPKPLTAQILTYASKIPTQDLTEEGRDGSHVTALHGLGPDAFEQVDRVVNDFGPVRITLGNTAIFRNENADVLYIEVDSPDLERLHNDLAKLPHHDSHPRFVAHVCVAYLRSGEGEQYVGDSRFSGITITFDSLTFCDIDGTRIMLPLGMAPNRERPEPRQAAENDDDSEPPPPMRGRRPQEALEPIPFSHVAALAPSETFYSRLQAELKTAGRVLPGPIWF